MFIVTLLGFVSVIFAVRGADFSSTNSRGVDYPTNRFRVWENLDPPTQDVAASMGYDETQWNTPGTFSLEYNRFQLLSEANRAAVEQLGIESDEWDCYVNHYRGYTWEEMETEGVSLYYEWFGFNATRWEQERGFVTQADSRLWDQLEPTEQEAARELCYFEELWNGLQIRFWSQTAAPTISSSVLATNTPTLSPTMSPSVRLTASPTTSPSALSSVSPTASSSTAPSVLLTAAPTSTPTFIPTIPAFSTNIDSVDSIRYVPWTQLSDEFQSLAISLGYDMEAWDSPGTAQVESLNFISLEKKQQEIVAAMGLTEAQWDCYINHYQGYSWDELPSETIQHLETLEWDSALWESGAGPPETRDRAWNDLGTPEREAAIALCYRYETWDMIPLEEWYVSTLPSRAPNGVMSVAPSAIQAGPASALPVTSDSPTMSFTTATSAAPSFKSSNNVPLSTIIISWEEANQAIESRSFERSIVDYLTAFFEAAAPSPTKSVDATALIVEDRSAIISGQVAFEDNASKISQQDLEDILIGHFSSTGTAELYEFLIASGLSIEGPLRVEVGGYDTSRPGQSNEEDKSFPWMIVIVIGTSVVAIAAAAVLIFTVRRIPKSIPTPSTDLASFRAPTTVTPSQRLEMDDFSIDQSLYTTDTYLQAVR
ncbi:hypothetical protein FisN_31Hh089 [Fistulifera solaris]|jgi:hypothetical protein|uniref:Uncharacterized protein n=1 Tax=Fistulifera solaris TaxID=1519565 RepID=A0A1Z5JA65_FISSO|nr:hypothetical protein FisN_31Hh089 [Fistulifera solaris]|eukprot:GAX10880.1 hypothetical protein FisN_31Hh089 [Fistulifera solaris]